MPPQAHAASNALRRLRPWLLWLLAAAALLSLAVGPSPAARAQQNPPSPSLPAGLEGAKVYHLPDSATSGKSFENLVTYKNVSYRDINLERLALNISVAIQPVDREATVEKIYFQNVQVDGFPVHVAAFDHEFQVSKKQTVDLPAPLECSIVYSDLDSVAPLQELVNQDKVTISGESFLEVKLNSLQKLLLRAKLVVIPVRFKAQVPLNLFGDSPFLKLAANKILETLADPSTTAALSLAKAHLMKLTAERTLAARAESSAFLLYCEYTLIRPQTRAEEKFVQYGTAFVVSADGKLLTAKRVIQPWKFDPQIAFLIQRYHLELDPKAYRLAAWPAGSSVLGTDGQLNFQAAFSTDKQTLKVLKLAPDQFQNQEYHDPDSGANATLNLHVEGPGDAAVLEATGGPFQPLTLAGGSSPVALLGYPYGLSQPQARPQPLFVQAAPEGPLIALDRPLNPGEPGAPLVSADGKVVALTGGGKECIPIESVRSLLP